MAPIENRQKMIVPSGWRREEASERRLARVRREKHWDLTRDLDVTTALLMRPLDWRVRAVEHIEIDASNSCHRRRSLQCAPLRSVLPERVSRVSDVQTASLVLNVAPVGRGPLRDFDVSGPLSRAFLLPRREIALREADYLTALAMEFGFDISSGCRHLLSAMLGLSTTSSVAEYGTKSFSYRDYLTDGLQRTLLPGEVDDWIELAAPTLATLKERLGESYRGGPEIDPLIAVPEYVSISGETTRISEVLSELTRLVNTANLDSGDLTGSAASEWINSFADYGTTFDLLVALKVPLDEPFVVAYSERRDLRLSRWRHKTSQDVVLADANSNHVSIETKDPNTKVVNLEARNPATNELTYGAFAGRKSDSIWTFYASNLDRDYRARLSFGVRPNARLESVPYLVAAMLVGLAAAMWNEQLRELADLAIVAGPSALAASLLLARDDSSLSSRLRGPTTWVVAAALMTMLATAVALYLSWDPAATIGRMSEALARLALQPSRGVG